MLDDATPITFVRLSPEYGEGYRRVCALANIARGARIMSPQKTQVGKLSDGVEAGQGPDSYLGTYGRRRSNSVFTT